MRSDWQDEWQDMPEYVSEKEPEPYATIIFPVSTDEERQLLAKALEQPLTAKTKSVRCPPATENLNNWDMDRGLDNSKCWVNKFALGNPKPL